MSVIISPIENGESGASVRAKLNRILQAAGDGTIGGVTQEDLDNLIDTTPPGVPKGLMVDSPWDNGAYLQIDWNANVELDMAYYDLQIREASGNWQSYQTAVNSYRIAVVSGISYIIRVRAVDKSGNASQYSTSVTIVGHVNNVPPAMPIGLKISAGVESIWVSWTANTEEDLAYYEVYESSQSFPPTEGDSATFLTYGNSFARNGLPSEATRFYWIRAVNTSNLKSPWSPHVTAKTAEIPRQIEVNLTDTTFHPMNGNINRITWSSGLIHYGYEGFSPTTRSISSGSAVYAGERVFIKYVIGDDALTTTVSLIDLYAKDSVLIGVYRGGADFQLVMGKTYTDGGMILAQTIGADQLVADRAVITGTAQIADAVITSAKIYDLDAGKLRAGTVLAGSITVDGNTLADISESASDPAAKINNGSTVIEPGFVRISGSSTLANWKNGPDSTEIDGGVIAAETIKANSLVIGLRGIDIQDIVFVANDPDPNFVSWTGGSISYLKPDGTTVTKIIVPGNAPWTTGIRYLYWQKDAVTISVTNSYATALGDNSVLLATYSGDTRLTVNSGRTLIDGSGIKTGSITADQMAVGSVLADTIAVANLAAISAQLGHITGGSLNINNKFIVNSDGSVQIQNSGTGARLVITNTLIMVYDANGTLRVRMGIWT